MRKVFDLWVRHAVFPLSVVGLFFEITKTDPPSIDPALIGKDFDPTDSMVRTSLCHSLCNRFLLYVLSQGDSTAQDLDQYFQPPQKLQVLE